MVEWSQISRDAVPAVPVSPNEYLPMDIRNVLDEWKYDPYNFTVRLIKGEDGKKKIQIRLDLGILQLEMEGRPDGTKPHDKESLLDYYLLKLKNTGKDDLSSNDFSLNREECDQLRVEAIQYYHRYISLLELEDYPGVIADTEHNLGILDILREFAEDKSDMMSYEQYRPYILMINTISKGRMAMGDEKYDLALKKVKMGIKLINKAREELKLVDTHYGSRELRFLEDWKKDISSELTPSELEELKKKLDKAIKMEEYESAADLRDEINQFKSNGKK